MKTKFSPLVKVKKNLLDKAQEEYSLVNKELQKAKEDLEKNKLDLLNLSPPTSGTISLFTQHQSMLQSQRKLIEQSLGVVYHYEDQKEQVRLKLADALKEYEKFKYLETQEIEELMKKQKIQESKDIDEMGLLTHSFKNKKSE